MRRLFSEEKPHVETVTCFKMTAGLAEMRALVSAHRWVYLKAESGADR